jgi:hypothetical protein
MFFLCVAFLPAIQLHPDHRRSHDDCRHVSVFNRLNPSKRLCPRMISDYRYANWLWRRRLWRSGWHDWVTIECTQAADLLGLDGESRTAAA